MRRGADERFFSTIFFHPSCKSGKSSPQFGPLKGSALLSKPYCEQVRCPVPGLVKGGRSFFVHCFLPRPGLSTKLPGYKMKAH